MVFESADSLLLRKDLHGEVCPANWKEGSKTIRADPTEKLEYFATVQNGEASRTKRARID